MRMHIEGRDVRAPRDTSIELPVSVVVAARNAEKTIGDSLASIKANKPAQIIVIDGNSRDGSVEIAKRFTTRIYSDLGRGYTYALQYGAELATQEYIAYVDADIILPPGTLATMLAELQRGQYVSICARLLPANGSSYWERAVQYHVEMIMSRRPGAGLFTALLRRSAVLDHRFDLSIPGGGDYELYSRLKRKGYNFGLSSASVYHFHRLDLRALAKQKYRTGREKAHFLLRRGPLDPEIWPPLSAAYYVILSLAKGKPGLVPYFVVSSLIETAGMIRELARVVFTRHSLSKQ